MKTYLPNEAHIARVLEGYSGPWTGEINQLYGAYLALSKDYGRLKGVCDEIMECEGDIKAVHIPHKLFNRFRDAVERL